MQSGMQVPVAEMKSRLSDFIAKTLHGHQRFIITRRKRPIAALVNIEDLQSLEQMEEKKGLSAVIGKWRGFDEIEPEVTCARAKSGNGGRHVSL